MIKNESKKNLSTIRTASRIVSYFFRHGNKEGIECLMRQVIIRRAIKKKAVIKPATSALFSSFFLVATPFVALKTRLRRRGKLVRVKVAPLGRNQGERKSMLSLSSRLQVKGAATKPFSTRIESELESLYQRSVRVRISRFKRKQVKVSSPVNATSASQLCEKRDEKHQLAYKSRPFKWKYKQRLRRIWGTKIKKTNFTRKILINPE